MHSVPYKWSNGLAISKNTRKTFERYSKGPVMGAIFNDPYLQACPRTMRLDNGEFIMWYNAGTEWNLLDGIMNRYILQDLQLPRMGFTGLIITGR